jgi:hypothetical protein
MRGVNEGTARTGTRCIGHLPVLLDFAVSALIVAVLAAFGLGTALGTRE